jgi:hypothetical protein
VRGGPTVGVAATAGDHGRGGRGARRRSPAWADEPRPAVIQSGRSAGGQDWTQRAGGSKRRVIVELELPNAAHSDGGGGIDVPLTQGRLPLSSARASAWASAWARPASSWCRASPIARLAASSSRSPTGARCARLLASHQWLRSRCALSLLGPRSSLRSCSPRSGRRASPPAMAADTSSDGLHWRGHKGARGAPRH